MRGGNKDFRVKDLKNYWKNFKEKLLVIIDGDIDIVYIEGICVINFWY